MQWSRKCEGLTVHTPTAVSAMGLILTLSLKTSVRDFQRPGLTLFTECSILLLKSVLVLWYIFHIILLHLLLLRLGQQQQTWAVMTFRFSPSSDIWIKLLCCLYLYFHSCYLSLPHIFLFALLWLSCLVFFHTRLISLFHLCLLICQTHVIWISLVVVVSHLPTLITFVFVF